MNSIAETTEFAPPRRSPADVIDRQAALFDSQPLIKSLLDPLPVAVMILNHCGLQL